jgi:hypothetical protein
VPEPDAPYEADLEDGVYQNGQGESPDHVAQSSIQLAHKAIAKFPELKKRYQIFVGTAAVVSSALLVMASIAVSKRLHKGESPESILEQITPEEIENAANEKPSRPRRRWPSRFLH